MMKRTICAKQDTICTDTLVCLFDFRMHRHTAHFQIQIRIATRHFQACVDIHTVSVPHMDHHHLDVGKALCEQCNTPGKRIGWMSAVNTDRYMIALGHLHHRVHAYIIRHKGMPQRIQLYCLKAFLQILLQQLCAGFLQWINIHSTNKTIRPFT